MRMNAQTARIEAGSVLLPWHGPLRRSGKCAKNLVDARLAPWTWRLHYEISAFDPKRISTSSSAVICCRPLCSSLRRL